MKASKIKTGLTFLKNHPETLVLSLIGLMLRLPLISNGIWTDEAISLSTIPVNLLKNPLFINVEVHPPLYFYYLKVWALMGTGLEWLRLSSIILGVVSIVICYELGVYIKGRRLGLILGTLVVVSPLHVYYSHELRPYALILVLTPLLIFFWLKVLRNDNPTKLALVSALCLLTHFTFIILVPPILLATAISLLHRRDYRKLRNLLGYSSILLVLALAIGLQKINQGLFVKMSAHVPSKTDWSDALIPLLKIKETLLTYFQFGNFYQLVPLSLLAIEKKLMAAFIGISSLWLVIKRRKYHELLRPLLPIIVVFASTNLIISYAEFLRLYPYGGRHILPLLFFWLVILAIFFDMALTKNRWLAGVALVILMLALLRYCPTFDRRQSFSNGYIEAARFAVQWNFSTINFVNPDKLALDYLKKQFTQRLTIKESNQIDPNMPNMINRELKETLRNEGIEVLYTNPQRKSFLIQFIPN